MARFSIPMLVQSNTIELFGFNIGYHRNFLFCFSLHLWLHISSQLYNSSVFAFGVFLFIFLAQANNNSYSSNGYIQDKLRIRNNVQFTF